MCVRVAGDVADAGKGMDAWRERGSFFGILRHPNVTVLVCFFEKDMEQMLRFNETSFQDPIGRAMQCVRIQGNCAHR